MGVVMELVKAESIRAKVAPKRGSTSMLRVKKSTSKASASVEKRSPTTITVVSINRAPVLTLWMDVCLRRLDCIQEVSLTAAKVITGRCANAKGKALGIISPAPGNTTTLKKKPAAKSGLGDQVRIAGHSIPLMDTQQGSPSGFRATNNGKPVDPTAVSKYLKSSFGANYSTVRSAMEKTARSYSREELETLAMQLYERFRPAWKGWGVKGELHLKDIRAAAK